MRTEDSKLRTEDSTLRTEDNIAMCAQRRRSHARTARSIRLICMYIRLIYAAYVVMSAAQGTADTPYTYIHIILIHAAYAACPHSAADGMALGGSRSEKIIFQSTVSRSATAHTEEHESDSAEPPPRKKSHSDSTEPPQKKKKENHSDSGEPLGRAAGRMMCGPQGRR